MVNVILVLTFLRLEGEGSNDSKCLLLAIKKWISNESNGVVLEKDINEIWRGWTQPPRMQVVGVSHG